jgi:hypothetical protein
MIILTGLTKAECNSKEYKSITDQLLEAIANLKLKRADIVDLYHQALISNEDVSWSKINDAIMSRWSKAGLMWIKNRAWKQ